MNKPSKPKLETKIGNGPRQTNCYSNLCRVTVSAEETILHFGERLDKDPNIGIGNAKIYLSLPHAKRLAKTLLRAIEAYEKSFGEIPEHPENHLTSEGKKIFGINPEGPKNERDH